MSDPDLSKIEKQINNVEKKLTDVQKQLYDLDAKISSNLKAMRREVNRLVVVYLNSSVPVKHPGEKHDTKNAKLRY